MTDIPARSISSNTERWYDEYNRKKGADRNDLLRNPEVAFQVFAADAAVIAAFATTGAPLSAVILDVGCGTGGGLMPLVRLGFQPARLHGIDIQFDRLTEAATRTAACRLVAGNAAHLPYATDVFDIVFESTMFMQITDENVAIDIANEMIRVCRPGGFILLSDWRYADFRNRRSRALSTSRLRRLFAVNSRTAWVTRFRGALIPPLGRFLSRHARPLYFVVHGLMPFLSGHVVVVLRKPSTPAAHVNGRA
ncbi:MAG TPA: class I SAM-dependent methyltransferase [Vicinamibacterales bacterium]|nr:class I SAM-dependent methyltransferase [Vicinamibacterales bacterium]